MDLSLPFMTSEDDCIVCDAGHACSVGTAEQLPCLPGSYGASAGQATCDRCPAGQFTSEEGATACRTCTAGYLCVEGSSAPQPCPGGTHADQHVLATVGYLSNLTSDCIVCPAGTSCSVGSAEPMAHEAPSGHVVQSSACPRFDVLENVPLRQGSSADAPRGQ